LKSNRNLGQRGQPAIYFRRFASEDVGLADPEAPTRHRHPASRRVRRLPEARIPLAHAYMCRAKESREAYDALGAATEEIESEQTERVPERLRTNTFPPNSSGTGELNASLMAFF
jgi:replication-associated recombination protein RarA